MRSPRIRSFSIIWGWHTSQQGIWALQRDLFKRPLRTTLTSHMRQILGDADEALQATPIISIIYLR